MAETLHTSAEELDRTLTLLSNLFVHHWLLPERADNAASSFQSFFSLLPEDGEEVNILALHMPVAVTAPPPSRSPDSLGAGPLEAAIGVRVKPLGRAIAAFLRTLGASPSASAAVSASAATPLHFDSPLESGRNQPSVGVERGDAENPQAVVFTKALLASAAITPAVTNLLLSIMPAHEGLWNYRRQHLTDIIASTEEPSTALLACMKEILWVGFLLTNFHKLQPLYVYRAWVVERLLRAYGAWRSVQGSSAHPSLAALVLRFQLFDWRSCFAFAAEKHPLNYNGWQYRRSLFTGVFSHFERAPNGNAKGEDFRPLYLRTEFDKTVQFLDVNNSDSSAASYLLFLLQQARRVFVSRQLHRCAAPVMDERPWEVGGLLGHFCRRAHAARVSGRDPQLLKAEEENDALVDPRRLWRAAFTLTQRQLHRHADKGHECFFFLRLGLVDFALCHNKEQQRQRAAPGTVCDGSQFIGAAWTVRDELAWVSALADGCHVTSAGPSPAAVAVAKGESSLLLTPTPPLSNAWVQCSGDCSFTAYLAARYGCQLITLLKNL